MPIQFICKNCGERIIVKFLKPGEIAACRNCSAENKVPIDAAETDELPDYLTAGSDNQPQYIDRTKLPIWVQLAGEINTIIIALLFYAFNLHIACYVNESVLIFQIPLIGRIILFLALLRLRKYDLGWPLYLLLIVNPIFILFDITMLMGMDLSFYDAFTPLEFILILYLLRNALSSIGGMEKLLKTITLVLCIEGALFICSFILFIFLVTFSLMQMLITNNVCYFAMTAMGGTILFFIIHFIMSVLLIYVAEKVKRGIKGLVPMPNR